MDWDDEELEEVDLDVEEVDADEPAPQTLSVPPTPKLVQEEVEPLAVPSPRRIDGAPPIEKPAAAAAEGLGAGLSLLGWVVIALILGAVGFVGLRFLLSDPAEPETTPGPLPPVEPVETTEVARDPTPEVLPPPPAPPEETAPEPTPDPTAPSPYGRETPGIADVGVTVAEGQGLLVLEPPEGPAPLRVRIGDEALVLSDQPAGIALAPGVHHLAFTRGDRTDFVWAAVREGHTRFAPALF